MNIEEFQKLRDQYKKALSQNGKELMAEAFRTVFDENPNLIKIQWTQYTPYFNDGDPCIFSRKVMNYYFSSLEEKDEDDEDEGIPLYSMNYKVSSKSKDYEVYRAVIPSLEKFENTISRTFDDSIFEEVFGNDQKVIATRADNSIVFETEDYYHD